LLHLITLNSTHSPKSRTPLDEGSAGRRDLYLTTHKTHIRQTSITTAGFKPVLLAREQPQTNVLDGATTGMGCTLYAISKCHKVFSFLKSSLYESIKWRVLRSGQDFSTSPTLPEA